jgi:hypothetical protein
VSSREAEFQSTDLGKYATLLPVGRLRITNVKGGTSVSGFLEENWFYQRVVASGNWMIEHGYEAL